VGLIAGPLSAAFWRVTEPLPPDFAQAAERHLKRLAFKPLDPARGPGRSVGWVHISQILDSGLTLRRVRFGDVIALGLRVDRLALNPRLFRAAVAQELARAEREKGAEAVTGRLRAAREAKVRLELLRVQTPTTAVYDVAWHLQQGVVVFGSTSARLNAEFGELFGQTFGVAIEPATPLDRAVAWARRQRMEPELAAALPAALSPAMPGPAIAVGPAAEEAARP